MILKSVLGNRNDSHISPRGKSIIDEIQTGKMSQENFTKRFVDSQTELRSDKKDYRVGSV